LRCGFRARAGRFAFLAPPIGVFTSRNLIAPFQIARISSAATQDEKDQQDRDGDSDEPQKEPADFPAPRLVGRCFHDTWVFAERAAGALVDSFSRPENSIRGLSALRTCN